jgi:HAD superfamily hydrolase (TIGR01549 family)
LKNKNCIALIDLDGTLINLDWRKNMSQYYRKIKRILPDMGANISYFYSIRWAAKKMMGDNSGDMLNIEKYFMYLSRISRVPDKKNREIYSKFYDESFSVFQGDIAAVEGAHELIRTCKEAGMKIVLATNPVFPLQAVKERLSWGKFDPGDFELITHIQNFSHCKPNAEYFLEILKRIGGSLGDAFMVGDDYHYDIRPCQKIGIKTWWYLDRKTTVRKKSMSGKLTELNKIISSGKFENLNVGK